MKTVFPPQKSSIIAMTDLVDDGLIKVSGKDVADYLQGQITADIHLLDKQPSLLSAICNVKGRVQSIFQLYCWQQHYYLRMNKTVIPLIVERLKKYAIFSKVTITDVSHEMSILGLYINDKEIKSNVICEQLSQPINHYYSYPIDDKRLELCATSTDMVAIRDYLDRVNVQTLDANDWQLASIKTKIATITQQSFEYFLPHDLGLEQQGAIGFNKGCYMGQEIIARMHYRGQLKQHLQLVKLAHSVEKNEIPPKTAIIMNQQDSNDEKQQTVGHVVEHCQNYLLAIVKDRYIHEPLKLTQPDIALTWVDK